MQYSHSLRSRSLAPCCRLSAPVWAAVAVLSGLLSGCAALTNPVAEGVPVRRVPPELLGQSREDEERIPLSLLRQKPPTAYRVGPRDILGIWIEGILGDSTKAPPVFYSQESALPPSVGFPIPVREDGTVALPLVDPIQVKGKTIPETQKAIVEAYTVTRKILKPEAARIIVTLQRPRTYHVLVVREDGGGSVNIGTNNVANMSTFNQPYIVGSTRRGSGSSLELPAYENDVLNALARTGGLPGLDAEDEVIIQRGFLNSSAEWPAVMPQSDRHGTSCLGAAGLGVDGKVIRIPLRLRPGEQIPFQPDDVILEEGDIVSIRAREADVFYTGGLLPAGEYLLPRDQDLDVIQAVSRIHGPLVSGGIQTNNFTGTIINGGLGFPSPSLISIMRKTPDHGQVIIKVDLNRAMREPRERLLIQPGDILVMQETPGEATVRYLVTQFQFNFLFTLLNQRDGLITFTGVAPGQ